MLQNVCSKYFIRFLRMLHLNVSCCTCFILFGESTGVGRDGGMARTSKNGQRRAGGRRSRRDGGGVGERDKVGGFESRRRGHAAGVRRVI